MQDTLKPLYTPSGGLMNAIAFASTSGTNFEAIYQHVKNTWIRAVFVDKLCGAKERAEKHEIPVIYESGVKFCGRFSDAEAKGEKALEDYVKKCEEYEEIAIKRLKDFSEQQGFPIDMLLLTGYMRYVRDPLLNAFPDRIINVHPARLDKLDENNERLYVGDNAVMKAIANGETETYSTVHIVTKKMDGGEIIGTSGPCKVGLEDRFRPILALTKDGLRMNMSLDRTLDAIRQSFPQLYDEFEKFCGEHQDRQKEICDWPTYVKSVRMIAQGRVKIGTRLNELGLRDIYIDDKKMPYGGYQLER